jgi:hypothetical protein
LEAEHRDHQVTFVLECVECATRSEGEARGWRAYLDDDSSDVWLYCADCAAREFGAA